MSQCRQAELEGVGIPKLELGNEKSQNKCNYFTDLFRSQTLVWERILFKLCLMSQCRQAELEGVGIPKPELGNEKTGAVFFAS